MKEDSFGGCEHGDMRRLSWKVTYRDKCKRHVRITMAGPMAEYRSAEIATGWSSTVGV
jgi:hypothetical protein